MCSANVENKVSAIAERQVVENAPKESLDEDASWPTTDKYFFTVFEIIVGRAFYPSIGGFIKPVVEKQSFVC